MTRRVVTVPIDHGEVQEVLRHLSLAPSALSPIATMLHPDAKGEKRRPEQVLEIALAQLGPEATKRQVDVLARPDRFLETRIALFGTAPDPCRFHASRAAGGDFSGFRGHATFDAEMLFPFNGEELLQWIYEQVRFSAGLKVPAIDPLVLDWRQFTAFVALLDEWKMKHAELFLAADAVAEPDVAEIPEARVLEALTTGRTGGNRRRLVAVVDELLRLLVRPGRRESFGLAPLDAAGIREGLAPWEKAGEVTRRAGANGAVLDVMPTVGQIGASLYTWVTAMSLHDVQIVSGGAGDAAAQEDLLILISTPVTVWAISVDGLTGWTPGAASSVGPKFTVRSRTVVEALDAARDLLQPVSQVSIRPDLYAEVKRQAPPAPAPPPPPPPLAPAPAPGVTATMCVKCGSPFAAGAKFCLDCGSARPAPAAPSPAGPICEACGAPFDGVARFCPTCGAPRSASRRAAPAPPPPPPACPSCRTSVAPGVRFCSGCGARVG